MGRRSNRCGGTPERASYAPTRRRPARPPSLDTDKAAAGHQTAQSLTARFATPPVAGDDVHDVLITHAYPIAWLVRHALDAPPVCWLGLSSANTALTVIEYRPSVPPEHQHVQRHEPPAARPPVDGVPEGDTALSEIHANEDPTAVADSREV